VRSMVKPGTKSIAYARTNLPWQILHLRSFFCSSAFRFLCLFFRLYIHRLFLSGGVVSLDRGFFRYLAHLECGVVSCLTFRFSYCRALIPLPSSRLSTHWIHLLITKRTHSTLFNSFTFLLGLGDIVFGSKASDYPLKAYVSCRRSVKSIVQAKRRIHKRQKSKDQ
jgi:hypothetical protein